jgi:hypothetical protein
MTPQLGIFGVLGILTTVFAVVRNRHLFRTRSDVAAHGGPTAGRVSVLEALYYVIGISSVCLGWYFNVRFTHHEGSKANYASFTTALFANFAADSAAQDYIVTNAVLLPMWTIVDGRRRGMKVAWIFFVNSLFTSLAFAVALYLAFVERQVRYDRSAAALSEEAASSGHGDGVGIGIGAGAGDGDGVEVSVAGSGDVGTGARSTLQPSDARTPAQG